MSDAIALPTVRTPADVRSVVADWRMDGLTVALVPTMGALHDGHISLVDIARQHADRVMASLFVNPTQFAPGEDFSSYPRDESGDASKLAGADCDLLYAPSADAIYPKGFATQVIVGGPSEGLESAARPHFFHGVGVVVAKLLIQTQPDVAVFGEKDYQQLLVIRRLATDLDLPIQIVGGPTIREPDGLAMSSRNAYLTPATREIAGRLNVVLRETAANVAGGGAVAIAVANAKSALLAAGFEAVDYVAIRDAHTLAEFGDGPVNRAARVLAAVRIDGVRLIDNVPVEA